MNFNNHTQPIDFPPSVNASAMEYCLLELAENETGEYPILIDLSKSTYVEITSLMMLISYINSLPQKRHIKIRLPRSKDVRDFFRTWNFPQALAMVVDYPFYLLVDEADRHYFGENEDIRSQNYAGRIIKDDAGGWSNTVSEKYFGFSVRTLAKNTKSFTANLAVDITNEWKEITINTVLTNFLGEHYDLLHSVVIFESVLNASRHPLAKTIVIASHLQDDQFFTLCIWDDGKSIASTIKDALDRKANLSSIGSTDTFNLGYLNFEYLLKTEAGNTTLPSSYIPETDDSDEILLFSSILPGITSTLDKQNSNAKIDSPSEEIADHPVLSLPGMGLFLLTNTVIDIFKGSFSVRSGSLFMNVKSHKKGNEKYSVKLTNNNAPFDGNLLTIRLPKAPLRKNNAQSGDN